MIVVTLTIIVLVAFLISGWTGFQKNACQLCEDSGRECYEYDAPELDKVILNENWQRIEYPEKHKPD